MDKVDKWAVTAWVLFGLLYLYKNIFGASEAMWYLILCGAVVLNMMSATFIWLVTAHKRYNKNKKL